MDLSILDMPIRAIRQAISSISRDEARDLLAAEIAGKTRKGVVDLLDEIVAEPAEATEPAEPSRDPLIVRNIISGTRLHLGDGRILAFGEEAKVEHELAVLLRERGQVE